MSQSPFVWVALDELATNEQVAIRLAHELDASVTGNYGFKVNADWIMKVGFDSLSLARLPERPIFVDLKMWLGARTMTSILEMAYRAGATATNIHALAGHTNPRADDQLADGEMRKAIQAFRRKTRRHLRIYGVSILTHYTELYCAREFGRDLSGEVVHLSRQSELAGADGVIFPGTQISWVDKVVSANVLRVIPGVRWNDFSDTRHEQEIHPSVVKGRADVEIVCGSPIYKAEDPIAALRTLLQMVKP